jgi:H+/Cl- antiporter ClcA
MVIACVICSLYSSFVYARIWPHNFALGITSTPQWIRAAIPLLVAGAVYIFQRRTTQRFQEKVAI